MAHLKLTIRGLENVDGIRKVARKLAGDALVREASRGVTDAGRLTRTKVQKVVTKQMNVRRYSEVASNVRVRNEGLSFTIMSHRGGQRLEAYKGLRVLKGGGARVADQDGKGRVKSDVWNVAHLFKRSFGTEAGTFATLPGDESTTAPRALWTWGRKPNQGRDAMGRFASTGIRYGEIRRLAGPALGQELGQDEALVTFHREAPEALRIRVEKRVLKLLEF